MAESCFFMAEIILVLILLINVAIIYLIFKLLPQEKKEEVLRETKINQGAEVMDWKPPQSDEELAFKEGLRKANE